MITGIIVFSHTGNTLYAARKLEEKFKERGWGVNLERITTTPDSTLHNFKLQEIPSVEEYDNLIFASPVHAFSLARIKEDYLQKLPPLENKRASALVTKQLPFNWTGGNRALNQMERICTDKGAHFGKKEVIIWSGKGREARIERSIENLCREIEGE